MTDLRKARHGLRAIVSLVTSNAVLEAAELIKELEAVGSVEKLAKQVQDRIDAMRGEEDQLAVRVNEAKERLTIVEKGIENAKAAAEQIVSEAKDRAAEITGSAADIVEAARADADGLLAEARNAGDGIIAKAKEASAPYEGLVSVGKQKVAELEQTVHDLEGKRDELLAQIEAIKQRFA